MPPSGSETVNGYSGLNVNVTTAYQLVCNTPLGDTTADAVETLILPAPTASLSASSASITLGESVTLTWASTFADSCTSTWSGSIYPNENSVETPTSVGTSTFSITCENSVGSATASTTVNVVAKASSPTGGSGGGGGGGGGAISPLMLLALAAMLILRIARFVSRPLAAINKYTPAWTRVAICAQITIDRTYRPLEAVFSWCASAEPRFAASLFACSPRSRDNGSQELAQ